MAFFEQIGKRITDAGQGVAQQTKNLSDIARLNGQISDRKKKMSQLFLEMGQDYYKNHRRDTACEEQAYIDQLNDLYAELSALKSELAQVKGVTKCPTCGAEIPAGSAFCTACGAKTAPAANPGSCPQCGAAVEAGNAFCNCCGAKLG